MHIAKTVTLLVLLILWSPPATAQNQAAIAERLATLERSITSLRAELSELRLLLTAVLPSSPISSVEPFILNISRSPAQGEAGAKLVIVELSDFECPFCGRHATSTYRELQRQYIDRGRLRYVFRHLPIPQLHPHALKAAQASECAREGGKFWQMHDRLFSNQRALARSDLSSHARALQIDENLFEACLNSDRTAARIEEDMTEARSLGFTSTPTFLIGVPHGDGTIRVTRVISGAQPLKMFQLAIEAIEINIK